MTGKKSLVRFQYVPQSVKKYVLRHVLYSPNHKKIYIGYTSDLDHRLLSHNDILSKGWTRSFQPWKLVYSESFETRSEAMNREKSLKTARGRKFIHEEIIANLETSTVSRNHENSL